MFGSSDELDGKIDILVVTSQQGGSSKFRESSLMAANYSEQGKCLIKMYPTFARPIRCP